MKKNSAVALLLCALIVLSLFSLSACADKNERARKNKSENVVMTVSGRDITELEFQILYSASVQTYLSSNSSSKNVPDTTKSFGEQSCTVDGSTDKTWAQYFTDYTETYCKEIYSVYAAATAQGLSPDNEYVTTQLTNFNSTASSAVSGGKAESESEYITSVFGAGVIVDDIKNYFEILSVYNQYIDKLQDGKTFTDDEKHDCYEKYKDSFDAYIIRLAFFNEDSKNEGLNLDEIDGLSDMSLLEIAEYFKEHYTSSETAFADGYANNFMTTNMLVSYGTADVTRTYDFNGTYFDAYDKNFYGWISSSEREKGDVYLVDASSSGATFVIYYIEKDTRDYNLVNFYEMLVKSDSASEVATKWEESDKSKEAFIALEKEYSIDPNKTNEEGYHTNVYKGYTLFSEINEWLFGEKRTPGECETFETSSGIAYIYFDSYGQLYRDYLANQALLSEYCRTEISNLIEKSGSETKDISEIWKDVPAANGSSSN